MSRLKIINLTIFLCFIQVLNSIWIGPYMMYLSMVQWTYPAKDIIGETGCYLMNILRGMHLHEVQLQSFFISLFRFTCLYTTDRPPTVGCWLINHRTIHCDKKGTFLERLREYLHIVPLFIIHMIFNPKKS